MTYSVWDLFDRGHPPPVYFDNYQEALDHARRLFPEFADDWYCVIDDAAGLVVAVCNQGRVYSLDIRPG